MAELQALKQLADGLGLGLIVRCKDEVVIYNEEMHRLTGHSIECMRNNSWFDLVIPDEQQQREVITRLVQQDLGSWVKTRITKKNGDLLDVYLSLQTQVVEGRQVYILLAVSMQNFSLINAWRHSLLDKLINSLAVIQGNAQLMNIDADGNVNLERIISEISRLSDFVQGELGRPLNKDSDGP